MTFLHYLITFAVGMLVGGGLLFAFRGKLAKEKAALAEKIDSVVMPKKKN